MKHPSRTTSGKFPKGSSGNPAGRPAGSRNKATLLCEQLLEDEAEALTRKVVEKAKNGDMNALRLCMERLVPVRKDRCVNLELRPISKAQDLPIQFQDIVSAVGDGTITPSEAQSLSDILTSHARVMETVELEQRVAELEGHQEEMRAYKREMAQTVCTEGQRLMDEDRKKT